LIVARVRLVGEGFCWRAREKRREKTGAAERGCAFQRLTAIEPDEIGERGAWRAQVH